ncbi:transporter substrate-binding domain-containing protein [Amycolatopsis sp. H20-H5]|uniref:transporter substrate-binding domain-containing protein n=1 Tax=Amycolatopsis sp. H20-H5 TaxID=3046309 RepID=UPI002DB63AFC|nr:transporter substrate-binding domain-containing protein [Amycolatopsis sp. H20-H5]MEC3979016.1 transporter substrate-binding domain-containing protein [Amycolatopsis sp. H20-H5]
MKISRVRASARTAIAVCTTVLLAASGACSGESPAVPGRGEDQNVTRNSMLDKAPIATEEEFAQSTTAQAIKQRGQLLVGSSQDTPLLSQQNPITGQTEGFDAIMGRLLAKYILGRPNVHIVNSVSQIREALLQNSTVDVVLQTYSVTPARTQKVGFAGPYFISGPAILARKDDGLVTRAEDLRDKTVLAVTNSTGSQVVRQFNPKEVITFSTNSECVQALEQHRGDVYVNDLTQLAGDAQLNNKVQVNSGTFGMDPYGVGIRRGDDAFRTFINNWLTKIESAGLWKQAYQESLGTVLKGEPPAPPQPGSVPGTS